jgi:hypothetical protein
MHASITNFRIVITKMEAIGNFRRGWEDRGPSPPVMHSPPSIIKRDDGSTVSGMTTNTTYGEWNSKNSRRNHQPEAIRHGHDYDDEEGNPELPPALALRPQGRGRMICIVLVIVALEIVAVGLVVSLVTSRRRGRGRGGEGGVMGPPIPDLGSSPGRTCGDGNVGNGICLDATLCCSKHGWCDNTPEHCADWEEKATSAPTSALSSFTTPEGTCGDGNLGNGICLDATFCCSKHGWCDNTPEHCADW